MASRNYDYTQSLERQVKFYVGKVSIAANAAVSGKVGIGFSAAKTGDGEYTITLEDKFPTILSVMATVEAATAVDLVAQVKSFNAATGVIVINLNAVGVPTNPSAVCAINFIAVCKITSV